jgi:hypothetical protein
MPMAPAQPLFLMHCGVNRITPSGRVAAADQRVSREGALRAVTLEAAYSLQMEHEVGSIVPGKLANFTILADNPVTCDATKIKDIAVIATMHEGRVHPVRKSSGRKVAGIRLPTDFRPVNTAPTRLGLAVSGVATPADLFANRSGHQAVCTSGGCTCATGRLLAGLLAPDASK